MKKHSSIVVGGGFVGLSCALHLQRLGRRVTVVDRAPLGGAASTSFGNAGTMAAYANVPVNSPALLRKLPGLMLDSSGPLSILPSPHIPRMLPWAALFAWNCRPSAVHHTAHALGKLLSRAEAGYEGVWQQAGVDVDGPMGEHASVGSEKQPFAVRHGYLLLQRSEEVMRASEAGAALRRSGVAGLRMQALSTDEVLDLEPALSEHVCRGGAWYFPDGWFLNEPGALLRALASGFEFKGGEVLTATALAISRSSSVDNEPCRSTLARPGGAVSLLLDGGGSISADEIVVAAGAHSASLVASIGEYCPLDTERGYSVGFGPGSQETLTRAVCDPSVGWIASPMASGLRVAGKVELGGTGAPPTPARWDQIERETQDMMPGRLGQRHRENDWLGFRPTLPDALPVIGRSGSLPEHVFYAFGHQHVGWTLGGITGELIAQLADGQAKPSVDLAPYRLGRFHMFG
jgi:glycine/D-amino acid oxidase-like deaminating enzyme